MVLKEEVKAVTTSAKPALSLLLKLMQPLQPPTQSWKTSLQNKNNKHNIYILNVVTDKPTKWLLICNSLGLRSVDRIGPHPRSNL